MNNSWNKLRIDHAKFDLFKKKFTYFASKGFFYGCLFSILLRKPKTYFPLCLGLSAGYCNDNLFEVFFQNYQ